MAPPPEVSATRIDSDSRFISAINRRQRGILGSLLHAIEGILHTAVHQRNMKVHVVAGIMVGLVGSGIYLGLAEKVTLIFCVLLVFFAEILNTALEALVDLHTDKFHELARVTKDAAAAGVLVLAIGTVIIFLAVMVANWSVITDSKPQILRQVLAGGPLTVLAALLMAEWKRSAVIDVILVVLGYGLICVIATWSTSVVFTALIASLFALCAAVSTRRRSLLK